MSHQDQTCVQLSQVKLIADHQCAFVQRPAMASSSSPSSLCNQCPSCHKWFTNNSNVLWHMNHPKSSCMSFSDFLESVRPPDEQTSSTYQQNYNETDQNDGTTRTTEAASNSSMGHYEELHPTEPFVFGPGPGFVDVFNMDQYAEKRRENLYYPFSSKGEWGLASWLLCSGLSMRAIDNFLALPIVHSVPNHRFSIFY